MLGPSKYRRSVILCCVRINSIHKQRAPREHLFSFPQARLVPCTRIYTTAIMSPDLPALFESLKTSFPSSTLGHDKWYILALSALVAGGHPEVAPELYTHLISGSDFKTPEQRQQLVRRLREALFKLVSVVGVPRPLEAVFQIAEVEREEDRDYSFSRYVICSSSLLSSMRHPSWGLEMDADLADVRRWSFRIQREVAVRPRKRQARQRLALADIPPKSRLQHQRPRSSQGL